MFRRRKQTFEVCLAHYPPALPAIATALGAQYTEGAFEAAQDEFERSGAESVEWVLAGQRGHFTVSFERYEGYFLAILEASGQAFTDAREALGKLEFEQTGRPPDHWYYKPADEL